MIPKCTLCTCQTVDTIICAVPVEITKRTNNTPDRYSQTVNNSVYIKQPYGLDRLNCVKIILFQIEVVIWNRLRLTRRRPSSDAWCDCHPPDRTAFYQEDREKLITSDHLETALGRSGRSKYIPAFIIFPRIRQTSRLTSDSYFCR